jgi:hypothetical protein
MQFPIIPYTPDQIQSFAPEQAMQAILPFSLEDKIAIAMVMLYRLMRIDFNEPRNDGSDSIAASITLNVAWALSDSASNLVGYLNPNWTGRQTVRFIYLIIKEIRRNYATDNRPGSDRRIKAGAGDAAAGLSERTHLESHRC